MHDADLALWTLARAIPGATRVFHQHDLDFCTGGRQTLRDAALAKGLDVGLLEAELDAIKPGAMREVNWARASTPALVEHILERYHARHRAVLPDLEQRAEEVEASHAAHPACPHGLAHHLRRIHHALNRHMRQQEDVLFPLIAEGLASQATDALDAMRQAHRHLADLLTTLATLTDGFTPPDEAPADWRALYVGARSLKEDLMEHLYLENQVLFERR
ncbi:DUF542 domain-containing protein [uncultured Aquabacterium sp.]|uniref:DUF542 domain-containing protein n=1 Tax=Aquabacterium sp. TaxID=1872578 RepID=UPI0025E32619|nr:DUF542 domain-containing protein [uncultured Aquabacterium sp.]